MTLFGNSCTLDIFFVPFLQDDTIEESGWKLVHGDVFRPPKCRLLLTACVGSGVQIFAMVLITLGMFKLFCLEHAT